MVQGDIRIQVFDPQSQLSEPFHKVLQGFSLLLSYIYQRYGTNVVWFTSCEASIEFVNQHIKISDGVGR